MNSKIKLLLLDGLGNIADIHTIDNFKYQNVRWDVVDGNDDSIGAVTHPNIFTAHGVATAAGYVLAVEDNVLYGIK